MSNREGAERDRRPNKPVAGRRNPETHSRRPTSTLQKKSDFFEKHDQFEQKLV